MSTLTWQMVCDKMDAFGIPKLIPAPRGQVHPTDVYFSATEWRWFGRVRIGAKLVIAAQDPDTGRWTVVREATYEDNLRIDAARRKQQPQLELEATAC